MLSFVYQYAVMWVIFAIGVGIGVRNGELGLSGRRGFRLAILVAGMLFYMGLQGAFTQWGTP